MSKPDREHGASPRKGWVKPDLKVISAGSAEADLGLDVKDGASSSAKS